MSNPTPTTTTPSLTAAACAEAIEAEFPQYVATTGNRWHGQDLLIGGEHARSIVRLAHEYGPEDGLTVYAMTANEVVLFEARFTGGDYLGQSVIDAAVRAAVLAMIDRRPNKWER